MSTTSWTARVDWATNRERTEDEFFDILERLAGLHPVIGMDPAATPGEPKHPTIMLNLQGGTLREAVTAAIAAVEDATLEEVVGVEVVPTDVARRRLNTPQIPPLVGTAEIAEILEVSKPRVAQLAARDDFPPAVQEIAAGPLRVRSQVEAWASRWTRTVGRPHKTGADS